MASGGESAGARSRIGFVMEQNLGHRTHYKNLHHFVAEDPAVDPVWMPVEFQADGLVNRLPLVRSNFSVRASLQAWRDVGRALRGGGLEAVLYHTQVTSLLSPLRRVPAVVSLDATPINYDLVGRFYGHASGGPLESLKWRVNRASFRAATALVSWCRWARASLVSDYGIASDKISVIAPGVDLDAWPNRPGAERVRASAGRLPRLLFVGGDFARKGGEVLLEGFRRSLRGRCELHLVTQTRLPAEPGVHVYNGVTPNSETLVRLYAEADVFVFPTLADCAPLAVPEAMAASLPVISTRVGAIPEMVRDGETGFLTEPGDGAAMGQAIERLLERPGLRASLGDAARKLVEAEYDARANARRLLAVIKGAAGTGRRP